MIVIALKSVFLIGIMSWYSAAIFTMINEYFLKEFNDYMKTNPPTDAYKMNRMQHIVSKQSSNQQLDLAELSPSISVEPSLIENHPDKRNTVVGNQLNTIIKHLVFSDNSRCLMDEYIVQIFLRNPVCMPT